MSTAHVRGAHSIPTERRRGLRLPCAVGVAERHPQWRAEGRTLNLSEGGLLMQRLCDRAMWPGERIELELLLPDEPTLRAFAQVIEPVEDVFFHSARLRFVYLSTGNQRRLRAYLRGRDRHATLRYPIARIALIGQRGPMS